MRSVFVSAYSLLDSYVLGGTPGLSLPDGYCTAAAAQAAAQPSARWLAAHALGAAAPEALARELVGAMTASERARLVRPLRLRLGLRQLAFELRVPAGLLLERPLNARRTASAERASSASSISARSAESATSCAAHLASSACFSFRTRWRRARFSASSVVSCDALTFMAVHCSAQTI